jgi:hypothetical protein
MGGATLMSTIKYRDPADGIWKYLYGIPSNTVLLDYDNIGQIRAGQLAGTANNNVSIRRTVSGSQRAMNLEVGTWGGVPSAQIALQDGAGSSLSWLTLRDTGEVGVGLAPSTVRPFPFAMAAGTITPTVAGGTSQSAPVTFPTGRFTVVPVVIAMLSMNSAVYCVLGTGGITTTGCNIIFGSNNGTAALPGSGTFSIQWVAYQMTAAAQAG